jgi:hypothetical protein
LFLTSIFLLYTNTLHNFCLVLLISFFIQLVFVFYYFTKNK